MNVACVGAPLMRDRGSITMLSGTSAAKPPEGFSVRELIRARADSLPARYLGQPEDIADAILFLMMNPYMSGHTLVIDGGATAA